MAYFPKLITCAPNLVAVRSRRKPLTDSKRAEHGPAGVETDCWRLELCGCTAKWHLSPNDASLISGNGRLLGRFARFPRPPLLSTLSP